MRQVSRLANVYDRKVVGSLRRRPPQVNYGVRQLQRSVDIVLLTQTDNPRLALRSVSWSGEPEGFSARLDIWSGDFGALRQVWFTRWALGQFLENLRKMDGELTGAAVLGDEHEPDHFALSVDRSGRVTVAGELFQFSECEQRLEFCFYTDQTVLRPLIRDLERLATLVPV